MLSIAIYWGPSHFPSFWLLQACIWFPFITFYALTLSNEGSSLHVHRSFSLLATTNPNSQSINGIVWFYRFCRKKNWEEGEEDEEGEEEQEQEEQE